MKNRIQTRNKFNLYTITSFNKYNGIKLTSLNRTNSIHIQNGGRGLIAVLNTFMLIKLQNEFTNSTNYFRGGRLCVSRLNIMYLMF